MSEFVSLLRWALLGLGITYFLTEAAIFSYVRVHLTKGSWFRAGLLYCPACTGFWVGLAISGAWVHHGTAYVLESGIALMAVAATWNYWKGGNPAYEIEAPLRGDDSGELPDDEEKESEDGR